MLNKQLAKGMCIIFCTCFLNIHMLRAQDAQDTLRLSLRDAEELFIKNNVQLLAQKYSIDSAKAGIITARLFDNPQFGVATGLYNSVTNKFFDNTNDDREVS